jgi:glucokinase
MKVCVLEKAKPTIARKTLLSQRGLKDIHESLCTKQGQNATDALHPRKGSQTLAGWQGKGGGTLPVYHLVVVGL